MTTVDASNRIDQLVYDCYVKSSDCILQGRNASISPIGVQRTRARPMDAAQPPSDLVEAYSINSKYCADTISRLGSPFFLDLYTLRDDGKHILIERWYFSYVRRDDSSIKDGRSINRKNAFLRTLYCFVRLLPGFQVLKLARPTPNIKFAIYNPEAVAPPRFDQESTIYEFPPLNTSKGILSIGIAYLTGEYLQRLIGIPVRISDFSPSRREMGDQSISRFAAPSVPIPIHGVDSHPRRRSSSGSGGATIGIAQSEGASAGFFSSLAGDSEGADGARVGDRPRTVSDEYASPRTPGRGSNQEDYRAGHMRRDELSGSGLDRYYSRSLDSKPSSLLAGMMEGAHSRDRSSSSKASSASKGDRPDRPPLHPDRSGIAGTPGGLSASPSPSPPFFLGRQFAPSMNGLNGLGGGASSTGTSPRQQQQGIFQQSVGGVTGLSPLEEGVLLEAHGLSPPFGGASVSLLSTSPQVQQALATMQNLREAMVRRPSYERTAAPTWKSLADLTGVMGSDGDIDLEFNISLPRSPFDPIVAPSGPPVTADPFPGPFSGGSPGQTGTAGFGAGQGQGQGILMQSRSRAQSSDTHSRSRSNSIDAFGRLRTENEDDINLDGLGLDGDDGDTDGRLEDGRLHNRAQDEDDEEEFEQDEDMPFAWAQQDSVRSRSSLTFAGSGERAAAAGGTEQSGGGGGGGTGTEAGAGKSAGSASSLFQQWAEPPPLMSFREEPQSAAGTAVAGGVMAQIQSLKSFRAGFVA